MDLTKLSREDKEKLLMALREKELLIKESVLSAFEPNKAQDPFFKSTKRIRALFGGNGSGKSVALVIEMIWAHTHRHPIRNTDNIRHTWCLVPGLEKVNDYWLLIKKFCPPTLLPKPLKLGTSNIRQLEWQDGSFTTFYSHDQEREKLEGTNIDAAFFDEPCPRDLWIATFRGLRNNPDYYVVIAGTPISEPWMYQEIYLPAVMKQDPNIEVFQGSIYDNPHVSEEFKAEFAARLTEDEKRTRLYGEFAALQGRVFKEFTRQTHVISAQTWPSDWPVWVAVDPHMRKKSTAVWMGVTPDDEFIVINETTGHDIPDLAKQISLIEAANGYRIVARRIDNSGSVTGWKTESAIQILRDEGKNLGKDFRFTPMRNAEKAVLDGIAKMRRKMLRKPTADGKLRPEFFIMDNCLNVITDLEMYGWDSSRNEAERGLKDAPKKIYDDFIDALRYIVMSNPRYHCALDIVESTKLPYAPVKQRNFHPNPRTN